MRPSPIHLTLKATSDELLEVPVRTGNEAINHGWLGERSFLAGASGPIVAGVFAVATDYDVGAAIFLGAVASAVSLGVDQLANHAAGRRYSSYLRASTYRQKPTSVTIGAEGLRLEAIALEWSAVQEVRRYGPMTLLKFSPVDSFVSRDADLPEGLTPEAFAAQIAEWRAA